ncbi:MAG TPA: ABC transporter substrate-binding protein [Actinomycetes bacterium]|nr:ABC transporter substrate-binding protein [Actinomycetes bacterium]
MTSHATRGQGTRRARGGHDGRRPSPSPGTDRVPGWDGGFNAGLRTVVNASTRTGGTLRFARTDDLDSLDPGDTYYAYVWNLLRLVGRTLLTYQPLPGRAGQQLVPDLATSLGAAGDGGRTWTYRLRRGVTFEDGTPVTAHHVKYAIRRSSFAPERLSGGPTYFRRYLDGPDAIRTPDAHTLVFHLREPFAMFDYLVTLPGTAPVPPEHDTGGGAATGPPATGPYRVHRYRRGERLELARNPRWRPVTDPLRRQLADRVVVDLGVDGHTVDERLLAGEVDVDLAGVGVQPATLARILAEPALRARADNPLIGFTWMYGINARVPPFQDIHCRRAVQHATDKAGMQAAYGGPAAGDIATTILPPTIDGYRPFDRYPCGPDGRGDAEAARAELAAAGMPEGFRTRIAAREDRLKEFAAAHALRASLATVGIQAEVLGFRSGDYFDRYAGVPAYLHANGIGIVMFGWGADFPDGFGFLDQIVNGRAVKPAGNHNFAEVDLPEVNALLDLGARTAGPARRAGIWGEIDRLVMEDASICPYLYAKSLLYRGPRATNVYVSGAYGMYDYVSLGVAEVQPGT